MDRTNSSTSAVASVGHVTPGSYTIGTDLIPGSGPSHSRRFTQAYWIDAVPLSWAHFEIFVADRGFYRENLWVESHEAKSLDYNFGSLDARYASLLENADKLGSLLDIRPEDMGKLPLTGVNWYEASAICRYFGARLPFEAEWEIAMNDCNSLPQTLATDYWSSRPMSLFGCRDFTGLLQEWTADSFAPYWRADAQLRGKKWTTTDPLCNVVVRGASIDDLFVSVHARTSSAPCDRQVYRGFRRVWDVPPTESQLKAIWTVS